MAAESPVGRSWHSSNISPRGALVPGTRSDASSISVVENRGVVVMLM